MKKQMEGLATLLVFVLVLVAAALAQAPAPPPPAADGGTPAKEAPRPARTTKLHIIVRGGPGATPISAAKVEVTSQEEGSNFSARAHTGADGGADLVVPRGKVLIQVIAAHWDVGGASPVLQQDKQTVEINLAVQAAHNDDAAHN
jgi:archaellin